MAKVIKRKAVTKLTGGPGQRRAGNHVSKKGERGTGMKFKIETFAAVSQFVPGTKIKYGPNPKRLDSLSFARYAKYAKAKTVGESLKCGAKIADFMWEYERGDYKVLGGARSEAQEVAAIGRPAYEKAKKAFSSFSGPNGCPLKNLSDPAAVEKLWIEEKWRADRLKRVEEKAKDLGLKVETTEQIEASTESADIRLQRRVTEALAQQKLKTGKKITESDVTEALEHWGFCENNNRLNVMPDGQKYVYSDTIGAIKQRTGTFAPTPPTRRYPAFPKLLCKWLDDSKPRHSGKELPCKFVCTAININCNYAGKRHRDGNNEGPSVIRAFGKFKGGRLRYFPKDTKRPRVAVETLNAKDAVTLDLSKHSEVFDGNRAHEVEPFTGERYSLVFFTASRYQHAKDVPFLKNECGFPWPTPAALNSLKAVTKSLK